LFKFHFLPLKAKNPSGVQEGFFYNYYKTLKSPGRKKWHTPPPPAEAAKIYRAICSVDIFHKT